jgi:hypothetical protein
LNRSTTLVAESVSLNGVGVPEPGLTQRMPASRPCPTARGIRPARHRGHGANPGRWDEPRPTPHENVRFARASDARGRLRRARRPAESCGIRLPSLVPWSLGILVTLHRDEQVHPAVERTGLGAVVLLPIEDKEISEASGPARFAHDYTRDPVPK